MQTFEFVSRAFSNQSMVFDRYEERNEILKWMRSSSRNHLLRHLKNDDKILELNAGTGLDAIFLAKKGYRVHCIDIAVGMLEKLDEKIRITGLQELVSCQKLSFTDIDQLAGNLFDHIFSNFGGLNCTEDLEGVFKQFNKILKPGGKVTLVIIPPVCLWELSLLLKGNFKTAFRRLHKNGVQANVNGIKFQTYYYTVKNTLDALGPEFKLIELQGLASFSPPPYMENFTKKYPGIYKCLTRLDEKLSHSFPFNRWADHFILTAQFNPE
jgi:ubiquinone/menaquinone biosynthesis C-methylase UbiE